MADIPVIDTSIFDAFRVNAALFDITDDEALDVTALMTGGITYPLPQLMSDGLTMALPDLDRLHPDRIYEWRIYGGGAFPQGSETRIVVTKYWER